MIEKELLREIDRIARESLSLEDAMNTIQMLFATDTGEIRPLVCPAVRGSFVSCETAVHEFLKSRRFPFRGLYSAPFGAGRLIACVGSWGTPNEPIQRLVDHAGSQLSSRFNVTARIRRQAEAA